MRPLRYLFCLLAASCFGTALAQDTNGTGAPSGTDKRSSRQTPVTNAVAKALPSVVNISTERIISQQYRRYGSNDPFSDFFNQYFGPSERHYKTNSLGSGVIIDSSGLIITNDHVVQRASRILITLADGTNLEATPVATDEKNDLALLRINEVPPSLKLVAIEFAEPDDLILGETVITVGNPFGLGQSVAAGVLSAIGRKAIHEGDILFDDILQTDAAINPGNSGGPLVNVNGQMIGINLAIQRDAEGIGFAIPLRRIEDIVCHWLIPERFNQADLGLVPGTRSASPGQVQAIVVEVRPESPAAKAGLKEGDVILRVDGEEVQQGLVVSRHLWHLQPGKSVSLALADGRTLEITLEVMPRLSGPELARERLQVELQELTPRLASALKLPYSRGLVVTDIEEKGVLGRRGVIKGDVIIQAGEVPVSDFGDFALAFEHVHDGDVIELVVDRVVERARHYFLQRFVVDIPFRL